MQEVKKIAVIGPESTGKSTICKQLAAHYNTLWCPEYAREYLVKNGTAYTYEDLLEIAKGQLSLEDGYIEEVRNMKYEISNRKLEARKTKYEIKNENLGGGRKESGGESRESGGESRESGGRRRESGGGRRESGGGRRESGVGGEGIGDTALLTSNLKPQTTNYKLLFIDTNMYVMKVWCEFVFNKCHQLILDELVKRPYDFYLLMDKDLPWSKDELREYPDLESRERLYHIYKDILVNQQVPWINISGTNEERLGSAIDGIDQFYFT